MSLRQRLSSAWNAFLNRENPTEWKEWSFKTEPVTYTYRPDRPHFTNGRDRSIITALLTRISVDCAQNPIQHIRVDSDGLYQDTITDELNEIFNTEANIDQTGRAFALDIFVSLLDEGFVAIVPIDTDVSPLDNNTFTIESARVGRIVEWYPNAVRVEVYNEHSGRKEQLTVPKATTAIVENPFYTVMNEPNSTMQRLNRKLNLLDVVDEQNSSGKLDLIIQLPYVVKTEQRKKQAEERRKQIEDQLRGSKYGIAYTDGTEKITQLNRPVENQLMSQVEFLTSMLYSQLGVSEEILNGKATPEQLNNYYVHTIEPIMDAVVDECTRKFLSKNSRTRGERVGYFRSLFKLLPITTFADYIDKFTRNEILTANEIRRLLGIKPSDEPGADDLRNKNNLATPNFGSERAEEEVSEEDVQAQIDELDQNDKDLDELEKSLAQADEHGGRIITRFEGYDR